MFPPGPSFTASQRYFASRLMSRRAAIRFAPPGRHDAPRGRWAVWRVPLVTRPRVLGLCPWARSPTFDRRRSAHEGVLREEFGFEGLVVSDWGAVYLFPTASAVASGRSPLGAAGRNRPAPVGGQLVLLQLPGRLPHRALRRRVVHRVPRLRPGPSGRRIPVRIRAVPTPRSRCRISR